MNPSSKLKKTLFHFIHSDEEKKDKITEKVDMATVIKPDVMEFKPEKKSVMEHEVDTAVATGYEEATKPATEVYIPEEAVEEKVDVAKVSDSGDKKGSPGEKQAVDGPADFIENPTDILNVEMRQSIVDDFIYKPILETNYDSLRLDGRGKSNIVVYKINKSGLKPFLEFCLYKYPTYDDPKYTAYSDLITFPTIKHSSIRYEAGSNPIHGIEQYVWTTLGFNVKCDGYKLFGGMYHFFFNVGEYEADTEIIKRDQMWWWCILDEIVNTKRVTNFPVYKSVYNFFMYNPDCLYLYDRENRIIEIPSVGYHGTYFGLVDIIQSAGLQPSTINAMMGPYYYFGTFRKAVRYAGWTSTYGPRSIDGIQIADENGVYEKGGILRYAMFLGKMKAFLNQPTDTDDYSDLVRERVKKSWRERDYEMMTLKLHDHNGKWVEEYDSAYVGLATITDGRKRGLFMKNPEFIIKYFNQFTLLSSHTLDKTSLKRKWDANYNGYMIE